MSPALATSETLTLTPTHCQATDYFTAIYEVSPPPADCGSGAELVNFNWDNGRQDGGWGDGREGKAVGRPRMLVGDGNPTTRRGTKEVGCRRAPSAADADDAEDRKRGAKQISGDKVNQLIRAHFSEVKQCLVGGRFKGGRARVVVQFTIQPTGKVGDSRVIESDVAGAGFQSCVAGIVHRITFPKPKEQSVILQFPFVFTLNN